jgi:hypothetical protein
MRHRAYILAVCAVLVFAVNGCPCWSSPPRASAVSLNGYTLLPLRYVAEWLGARVTFERGAITLILDDKTVTLRVGSTQATVCGKTAAMSCAAVERSGATYVPLRFVGQALGAKVDWDGAGPSVKVTHPTSGEVMVLPVIDAASLDLLRFDGVYQGSPHPYPQLPEFVYYVYIRFYPDGTMSLIQINDGPQQVFRDPDIAKESDTCHWTVIGKAVAFTHNTVQWTGVVRGDTIAFRWRDPNNGARGAERLHFVRVR